MRHPQIFPLLVLMLAPGCNKHASTPSHPSISSPTQSTAPTFVDVTDSVGIDFRHQNSRTPRKYLIETMGSGCAFVNYDGDEWLDILLLNNRQLPGGRVEGRPTIKLYRNERGKRFRDVTNSAGLEAEIYAMGVTVGDYDNDGRDDIYVSCVLEPGRLFHNEGGRFKDTTKTAGVGNEGKWGTSCAWLDYDKDGKLDLFIANYVKYRGLADDLPCYASGGRDRVYCIPSAYETSTCTLYRNLGGGRFHDVSAESGIAASGGKSLGVTVWDYDDDGDPDVFVANDTVAGFLFRNEGDGTFKEIGVESGVAYDEEGNPHSGMGTDTGDLQNDGKSWLAITNYQGQQTSLYKIAGTDIFRDERFNAKVAEPTTPVLGFGILFFDFDNDGYRDIAQVNGHVQDDIAKREPTVSQSQPSLLLRNRKDGTFEEVGLKSGAPFTERQVWRGIAAGDYDNDGRVDLMLTSNNGPARLWRNNSSTSGHWIGFKLIGNSSARNGHGAIVLVTSGGITRRAMIRSGSSYLSQSDLRAHVGLGPADKADVEVRWPSGKLDRLVGLNSDRYWLVREGTNKPEEARHD